MHRKGKVHAQLSLRDFCQSLPEISCNGGTIRNPFPAASTDEVSFTTQTRKIDRLSPDHERTTEHKTVGIVSRPMVGEPERIGVGHSPSRLLVFV